MNTLNTWKPVYFTLSLILLSTAFLASLDQRTGVSMIKDVGLIQLLTIGVLCSVVLLALAQVIVRAPSTAKWVEASFILAVYCMREMDFHRLFTAEHVTKLKLYTGPYPLNKN